MHQCITKIDGTTIDDAEDLDLVMIMHNLIECSSNYPKTAGSFWFIQKIKQIMLIFIFDFQLLTVILSNLTLFLPRCFTKKRLILILT